MKADEAQMARRPDLASAGAAPAAWQAAPTSAGNEGDIFVPYSLVPAGACGESGSALVVRVRSVEGWLSASSPKISLDFRFGPLTNGARMDKSANLSVKCQIDLVKQGAAWLPDSTAGGTVRVLLPPSLLAQSRHGVACRLKATAPGFVTANVLAVSTPLQVPQHPGPVALVAPRAAQGKVPPVATATLSIGRPLGVSAQKEISKGLVQQLFAELARPSESSPAGSSRALAVLDVLHPSRGWLAAAGIAPALAFPNANGKTALRLAVDGHHWECVVPLMALHGDLHLLADDLRSPLTAAVEQGGRHDVLLAADSVLSSEQQRVVCELAALLSEGRLGSSRGNKDVQRRWNTLVEEVTELFKPPEGSSPPNNDATDWTCDIYALALEHCPTGKARRELLKGGTCAALWRGSLLHNLPDLARKLAVWIGLAVNNTIAEGPGSLESRRKFLDVQLENGTCDCMLARVLEKATTDERWVRVARVLVNLGAQVNATMSSGQSLLLYALEQSDKGQTGFREVLSSLLDRIGSNVDQWDQPTVLFEERTSECPICFETLWTSTPTAFVSFTGARDAEGPPHAICAHFFCFDCASQQYMKQQSQARRDQEVNEYHCPICRTSAREVMPLPEITVNPRLWFQFLDMEGKGQIDKNTVVQALEAILPLDTEHLRGAMDEQCWAAWDKSRENRISEIDFFASGGLLEWVRGHQHEMQTSRARGPSPALDEPELWFKHWDCSRRGRLRKGDFLRALCEACQVSSLEIARIQRLKGSIDRIWARHMRRDGAMSLQRFLAKRVVPDLQCVVQEMSGEAHDGITVGE